ncbi:MAG: choice-of-anchor E domain-containing protein [Thermoleophilia bacterium]|nr:choice-of-anchor E domain-containing protein [Thermoleophilia bacterium]
MPVTRLRRVLALAAVTTTLFAIAPGSASALTVTHQSATSCDQHSSRTNWTHALQLPQFNVPGGTLTAVTVSWDLSITSDYRVESEDNEPQTVTLTLDNADAQLVIPGVTTAAASLPAGGRTYSFTAWDGTTDYAGTSGATGGFGVGRAAAFGTASNPAAWTGAGTVSLPATAAALTHHNLSGNHDLKWTTVATASACVTYTYTTELLVCIGDYVWHDDDHDGIQDPTETPVEGRPITVTDAAGHVIGTATTDSSGRWIACGLEPSTACVVSVDLPDGWTVTRVGQGADRGLDSDGFATASGDATIPCVTTPSGEDRTFDVGIYQPPTPIETPAPTPASLRMSKASNRNVIGSRAVVTFTVRVTNRGQSAVRNLRVCDTPPTQLAFTTRPRGATMRNGQLCWTVRALGGGRTVTYRYTMRAASVASRMCVSNRATAVASTGGSASARDGVCIRATRLGVLKLAG